MGCSLKIKKFTLGHHRLFTLGYQTSLYSLLEGRQGSCGHFRLHKHSWLSDLDEESPHPCSSYKSQRLSFHISCTEFRAEVQLLFLFTRSHRSSQSGLLLNLKRCLFLSMLSNLIKTRVIWTSACKYKQTTHHSNMCPIQGDDQINNVYLVPDSMWDTLFINNPQQCTLQQLQ